VRILIDINHPGQVHLFKCAVREWEARGHQVLMVARDKDVTLALLEAYRLPYVTGTSRRPGLLNLLAELLRKTNLLVRISREFTPDVFVSLGSPPAAWASSLVGVPHIVFEDTEHSTEQYALYAPFTEIVYTPSCFTKNLGRKQRRYAGYHELAYLHPDRFTPDPRALERVGLDVGERFSVVRFVSWGATHDIGQQGFGGDDRARLLEVLREHGRVIVSSESQSGMEEWGTGTRIQPIDIHHLLYYATLYVGEGGTMATEAAILGTPSVFVNTLSGGNWDELEKEYRLLFAFRDGNAAVGQVRELLQTDRLKEEWAARRERMLADKIDVTQFIVSAIEQAKRA
jgi:predicted glycosyltransferase